MAERGVISPENIPTFLAVSVVTALLCFAYTINVTRELKQVTNGAAALDVKAARRDVELERQLQRLQARVAALEGAAAPTAATPAADTPQGASTGSAPAP